MSLSMQIIDGSTVMTYVLWAWFDAELLEHLDGQALEADEVHHVELGWLRLQELQGRHPEAVLGTKQCSVIQKMLEDGYAVVFL